jgi:hypothetical protein
MVNFKSLFEDRSAQTLNLISFIVLLIFIAQQQFIPELDVRSIYAQGGKELMYAAPYVNVLWSVIYILVGNFIINQSKSLFFKNTEEFCEECVNKLSYHFVINCIYNMIVIYAWINQYVILATVALFGMTLELFQIFLRINSRVEGCKIDNEFFLIRLPFKLYFAWACMSVVGHIGLLTEMYGDMVYITSEMKYIVHVILQLSVLVSALFFAWRYQDTIYPIVTIWIMIGLLLGNQASNPKFYIPMSISALIVMLGTTIFVILFQNKKVKRLEKEKKLISDD